MSLQEAKLLAQRFKRGDRLEGWDELLALAYLRIAEIKRSITTFESLRAQGMKLRLAEGRTGEGRGDNSMTTTFQRLASE